MQDAGAAFAGASFHCYAGNYSEQLDFYNAFPDKARFNFFFSLEIEAETREYRKYISPNALAHTDRIGGAISRWLFISMDYGYGSLFFLTL